MLILFSIMINSYSKTLNNVQYYWAEPPNVYNCSDSGVSSDLVESSLSFWSEYGFRYKNFYKSFDCSKRGAGGIYIYGDSSILSSSEHARTRLFYFDGSNEIQGCNIYFSTESLGEEKVITHEIGHAFGLEHVNDVRDIMFFNARISGSEVTTLSD